MNYNPALYKTKLSLTDFVGHFDEIRPSCGIWNKAHAWNDYMLMFDEESLRWNNDNNYEIYYAVNKFSTSREEKNLVKLRALYTEWDCFKEGDNPAEDIYTATKLKHFEAICKCPLTPHIITDTKNGFHVLWFIDENSVTALTISTYKTIIKYIRLWSQDNGSLADKESDVTRVLRLPSFYHKKNPAQPYLIESYKITDNKPYSLEDALNIFYREPVEVESWSTGKAKITGEDSNSDALSKLSIGDVAVRVMQQMGYEHASIMPDGRLSAELDDNGNQVPTGAFIGKNNDRDYIASTSKWFMPGNIWTVVRENLHITDHEIFEWFKKEFEIVFDATPQSTEPVVLPDSYYPNHILDEMEETLIPSGNTGIAEIDKVINGFYPGVYAVGADQKVGKSALLMNFIINWLENKKKVIIIESEQGKRVYMARLASVVLKRDWDKLTANEIRGALQQYLDDDLLVYLGEDVDHNKSFISNANGRSWAKAFEAIKTEAIKTNVPVSKPDFIVIDNLTSFATKADGKTLEHMLINSMLQDLITTALQTKTVIFAVIHTNKNVIVKENAVGIYKALKENDPDKIIDESVSIDAKPATVNVKGGSASLGQCRGTILLWRPYKDFANPHFSKRTVIILNSFTNAPSLELKCDFFPKCMSYANFKVPERVYDSANYEEAEFPIHLVPPTKKQPEVQSVDDPELEKFIKPENVEEDEAWEN